MQPSWRNNGESLVREVPRGESWQTVRKGGTSGMYVVVIGLSWWVKAQHDERDVDAWTLVDDVSWVIQQLKKNMGSTVSVPQKRGPQKRMHDADTGVSSRKT